MDQIDERINFICCLNDKSVKYLALEPLRKLQCFYSQIYCIIHFAMLIILKSNPIPLEQTMHSLSYKLSNVLRI